MSFFFIPIVFGCPTRISASPEEGARVCPRCNNVSVVRAKSRTWFELCFVPLIPMASHAIWYCSICSWSMRVQPGWEPAIPGTPGIAYHSPRPPAVPIGYFPVYHSPDANQTPPPPLPSTNNKPAQLDKS